MLVTNIMKINEFHPHEYDAIEFNQQLNARIRVCPMYFQLGFSPSPTIFGRFAVLDRLLKALEFLPQEYGLLVWDVYRPRAVQAQLYSWMKEEIRKKMPHLNEEGNEAQARKYMSPPSKIGDDYCPPHLSGGAIDLTLFELDKGSELDMGTPFDDCSERAHRDYFSTKTILSPEDTEIKHRRYLLRSVMERAGFTSYHYEWWHFDLGNIFWSRILNQPAVFGPLFGDDEWP